MVCVPQELQTLMDLYYELLALIENTTVGPPGPPGPPGDVDDEEFYAGVAQLEQATIICQAAIAECQAILEQTTAISGLTIEQAAMIQTLGGYYPGARSFVPQGIVTAEIANAGTGGTPGTYRCPLTGDNLSIDGFVTVVVGGGGTIQSIQRVEPGLYLGASLTIGTVDTSGITGLTGESVVPVGGYLSGSGEYYVTDHASDPDLCSLFQNQSNVAVEIIADFPVSTAAAIAAADAVADSIDTSPQLSTLVAAIFDSGDNALLWFSNGLLESEGFGPTLTVAVQEAAGIDPSPQIPTEVMFLTDNADNVVLWITDGLLDGDGVGETMLAAIAEGLGLASGNGASSSGRYLRKFRARLANLTSIVTTQQPGLWMDGDSWINQINDNGDFANEMKADIESMGVNFAEVASGWLSIGSEGQVGSASLDFHVTGTIHDISEEVASGEYSPDGYRRHFPAATTGNIVTIVWRGDNLRLWVNTNGALFTHITDGGTPVNVTLLNTGVCEAVLIPGGAEGLHTTVISRPSAAAELVLYGLWATSALPGTVVNKCGNSGLRLSQMASARITTTSRTILAAIAPETIYLQMLTNDSSNGDSTSLVASSLTTVLTEYRTANPDCEFVFVIPPQHNADGVPLVDYESTIRSVMNTFQGEYVFFSTLMAGYVEAPWLWVDNKHLLYRAGGSRLMVRTVRKLMWSVEV